MKPELGNISWISHSSLAKLAGCSRQSVNYHLQAAEIIGEIRIRFTDPSTADDRISQRYGNYTTHTDGKTFSELLRDQRKEARKLNFYTINDRHTLLQGHAYPAWMVKVISLCARCSGAKLKQAHQLANEHELSSPPEPKRVRSWREILSPEAIQRLREHSERSLANCKGADTPAPTAQTLANCKARFTEPLLSKQEDAVLSTNPRSLLFVNRSSAAHADRIKELKQQLGLDRY
jgi:hypothetical protein